MRHAKPNRAYGFAADKHASPSHLGSPGVAQSHAGMRVRGHRVRVMGCGWVASYPRTVPLGSNERSPVENVIMGASPVSKYIAAAAQAVEPFRDAVSNADRLAAAQVYATLALAAAIAHNDLTIT